MSEIQRWKQELQHQMGQEGPSPEGAIFAVAYSLALIAEKVDELGFNADGTVPGVGEAIAIAMALGYSK